MSADVCVFCSTAGCANGTAQHGTDCPFTTGMWPIDEEALRRETVCAACDEPFALGDLCAEVSDMTHPAVARAVELAEAMGAERVSFAVCLPCAALDRDIA